MSANNRTLERDGLYRPLYDTYLKFADEYSAINLGVSGDSTDHALWRVRNGELPPTLKPAVVVLAIGINDVLGLRGNRTSLRVCISSQDHHGCSK